ncbi:MAG: R2-like ligand-binding oxidase [Anaerolineae bacterium]
MHDSFITTTRGLRRDTPPMRLYEKAKRLGVWNPSDIDLSRDRADWQRLSDDERDLLLRLTALFQAGEEAVTLDLLPLIAVIAQEGRLEEELYLTTFLFEEAKHTDFFSRFLSEVAQAGPDLSRYHTEHYRAIFYHALPEALQALRQDTSPSAQARASVTYNMIVEGMLAETGYHVYFSALEANDLLPGQRQGIALLKQDESRHIAYGVFLLSRLIAEHEEVWEVVDRTFNALMMPALGIIRDAVSGYTPIPFGLREEDFLNYAMMQFSKRRERLMKARGQTLDEVYRVAQAGIDRDEA